MNKDRLGDRMKGYEKAFQQTIPKRMPVIVRVDGKAFHTWTKGLPQPFCAQLMGAMDFVAAELCREIQGAQFAYVQSDEISILIHNYKRLETQAAFANELPKMVSVSAGIASAAMTSLSASVHGNIRAAVFDSRAFVLPEHDVTNYFVWRQKDAMRNALQMVARSLFSHNSLIGKNTTDMRTMILNKTGRGYDELAPYVRRGRIVDKQRVFSDIPEFTKNRDYIEKYLKVVEE